MRRVLLLVCSLLIVGALGGVAAWTQLDTSRRVSAVHGADRSELQSTLAGLTSQYMSFTFLAAQTAATQTPWSLKVGDPADTERLRREVASAPLTSYGAALVTTAGAPMNASSPGVLPPATDPGYEPMRSALLSGQPGLSGVMRAGGTSVVAFAVPISRGGSTVALLLSYADVHRWPLQGYDEKLRLGQSAQPYVLDSAGTVAASGDAAAVGKRFTGLSKADGRTVVLPAGAGTVRARVAGRSSVVTYGHTAQGWTVLTVQDEAAFSGALQAGRQRDLIALVALLTLVVALLVLFHYKRQQALQTLAENRLYDPLTGLAQRRLFEIRLEAAVARQRRSGKPVALLYGDLDGFKAVNDRHGHNVGDSLLALVAQRLLSEARDEDMVVRLGGDEFAILLEGSGVEEVSDMARRLADAVQAPAVIGSLTLEPRISIGGALLLDVGREAELVQAADLAMYQVKTHTNDGRHVITELRSAQERRLPEPRVSTPVKDTC
jgi:diguanylate cyclase (GGDEF)-like protein